MNQQHHHRKGGRKPESAGESVAESAKSESVKESVKNESLKESVKAESPQKAKVAESAKAESVKTESHKESPKTESPQKAKTAESPKTESSPKPKIAESPESESPESENTESAESPEVLALRKALEEANQQVAQLKDAFLRAKAESENTRRRAEEEIAKARKFALEGFAKDLLAPWDSLDAALNAPNQSLESLKEGLALTKKQLDSAFQKNALLEINPQGQKFDPHQHQAVGLVPAALPKDTVAVVLQKGFLIAERVLRPAMVMVSNGENAENPPS